MYDSEIEAHFPAEFIDWLGDDTTRHVFSF
jgi:hypothetical protein